ncbi:MAG: Uma2 family endonuclease [Planctomycetota bacterium]|nr:Uma2 family endonuclease [Planctomycetota bacterium]MDA1211483.1 Uma2 family endonuclease [Planctomycetota bacterium]
MTAHRARVVHRENNVIDQAQLTAEKFAERRPELPDGGQWVELVAGRISILGQPDDAHGVIVLNLSKEIGEFLQAGGEGYACFDLGLVVAREPDTVRWSAMAFFTEGERFAESDKLITDTRPALVVEVASSNARRRDMRERVLEYLRWGVNRVWVIDPDDRQVHIFGNDLVTIHLGEHETIVGHPVLSGLNVKVKALFAEPKWWTG